MSLLRKVRFLPASWRTRVHLYEVETNKEKFGNKWTFQSRLIYNTDNTVNRNKISVKQAFERLYSLNTTQTKNPYPDFVSFYILLVAFKILHPHPDNFTVGTSV